MFFKAVVAALIPLALATKGKGPDKDGKYWIKGDGIQAAFIPYGASITNLLIDDQYGISRDIVAGFDNATHYSIDKSHPHLGGVPGRYANRIRNSTFEIDGKKYHVTPNDNPTPESPKGADTLHGGPDGWDYRNFTVVSYTDSSITFSIVDPDGKEGFPGEVVSYVTYTLTGMDWDIKIIALATTKKTPIMLTSHTYWNLDGFSNNETSTISNHTLHMPYGGQRVATDNILIPTGDIIPNKKGSVNDFWSKPKMIGDQANNKDLENNCGFNCTGYGQYSFIPINDFANKFQTPATASTAASSETSTGELRAPWPLSLPDGLAFNSTSTQIKMPSSSTAAPSRRATCLSRRPKVSRITRTSPELSPSMDAWLLRFRTTLTASTTLSGRGLRSSSLSLVATLMFFRPSIASA
jgi:galactose mutarotase-like enzyme